MGWTVPIGELYGTLDGPTVYGGYGCTTAGIPNASTLTLAPGEEAILVLQRGPVGDPSQTGDACFFSNKVETAQLLGYDAVIIANHHSGALGGVGPDSYFCGAQGHEFDIQISALCIGHRAMHELFDDPNATDGFTYPETVPAIGTVGDRISVTSQFDGWGYVHLFDAATLQELDTFAIPEAMDPAFASGFGDLSVHEVAVDPQDPSLAYLSSARAACGRSRSSARTRPTPARASSSRSGATSTPRATTSGASRRSSARTASPTSLRVTATAACGSSGTRDPVAARRGAGTAAGASPTPPDPPRLPQTARSYGDVRPVLPERPVRSAHRIDAKERA